MSRDLGVDAGTPSEWVAQASPDNDADRSDNPFQMAEDLRRHRRENERLRREDGVPDLVRRRFTADGPDQA